MVWSRQYRSYGKRMWIPAREDVPENCRTLDIPEQAYLPLASEIRINAARDGEGTENLQKEDARLKKLVAEQPLDMDLLKEAAKGNR